MFNANGKLSCAIAVFSVLCAGGPAHAGDQTWLRNILKWNVADKIQLWSAQEYRNHGFSLYNDPFTEFLEIGISYAPKKSFYGAAGYRHQWNEAGSGTVLENRWIAMVGAKIAKFGNVNVAARLRFDGKYFDRADLQDYIWYRLLVNHTYRVRLAGVEFVPHFTVEIFGDTRPQSKIFINRKRFHFGTTIPIGGHLQPLIEYMRQDIHDRGTDHALRVQLIWTV